MTNAHDALSLLAVIAAAAEAGRFYWSGPG